MKLILGIILSFLFLAGGIILFIVGMSSLHGAGKWPTLIIGGVVILLMIVAFARARSFKDIAEIFLWWLWS